MSAKTEYICTICGYKSPRWLGKCPSCQKWDTFKETEKESTKKIKMVNASKKRSHIPCQH